MKRQKNPFLLISSHLRAKPFSTQELVCDGNNVTAINKGDLSFYPNLQALYIPNNKIKLLENLDSNIRLTTIDARNNQITDLNIRKQTFLIELCLANNKLQDLDSTIVKIEHLKNLETLDLRGNPLTLEKGYRQTVISHMPWLKILDGLDVQVKEKMPHNITNRSNQARRPRSILQTLIERPLSAADSIVKIKAEKIRIKAEMKLKKKQEEETEFSRRRAEEYEATALSRTIPLPEGLDFLGQRHKKKELIMQEEVKKRPYSRMYLMRPVYTTPSLLRDDEEILQKLNPTLPPMYKRVENSKTFGK